MTTWNIPDEPGPEVRAVYDRHDDRWRRTPYGWINATNVASITWQDLIALGPLTDATNDNDKAHLGTLHAVARAARSLINAFGNTFRHPDEPVISAYWALRDTVDRLDRLDQDGHA